MFNVLQNKEDMVGYPVATLVYEPASNQLVVLLMTGQKDGQIEFKQVGRIQL